MKLKEINNLFPSEAIGIYYRKGFNVIPIKGKEAVVKQWSKYSKERIPEELISKFARKIAQEDLNIAVITGFSGLLVYDCDSEDLYLFFKEKFKEIFGEYPENKTLVCKTAKGYHVYFRVGNPKKLKGDKVILQQRDNEKIVEIRRKFRGYVVVPPSLHPSGVRYVWIHSDNIDNPLEVSEETIIKLESLINPELWPPEMLKPPNEERDLTEEEIEKLVAFIKPYWIEGQRQLVLLALSYILRVFGRIKYDSVVKLYEKIKETLGDDPKDYSQRIGGIRLTFEKEIDEIAYRRWLEELGWEINNIEEFKLGILKAINKSVRTLFKRGFQWIYRIKTSDWREVERDDGSVIYLQKVTLNILTIRDGKVLDEERNYLRVYDGETKKLLEERFTKQTEKKLIVTKTLEYLRGHVTPNGTYVKLAIIDNDKKHIIEGLLDDVLEMLHKRFRVLTQGGKEKLGQLLSFLAKFEDKVYTYPGIIVEGNRFIPVIPGVEEEEHLFPETENQLKWIRRIKESLKVVSEEDFILYLKAWLNYKDYLPIDVYYVALGYTFVAPLLHSLVSITDLKPGLYLIGPKKSGKTTLGKFIAVAGYGSPAFARSVLGTEFRFDEVFSAGTIPILIDEIENAKQSTISRLKSMLTGEVESFRGHGSLKIKEYKLIATPIITANRDALNLSEDPALFDRLIVLRLDQRLAKEQVLKFKKEIEKLMIGNRTVAFYLLKTISEVANDLGGFEFFKRRFEEIYNELITMIESEGRNIEKASIIVIGLEIANEVFRRVLGQTIDLSNAKKVIIDFFRKSIDIYEFAPEELINLASILKEPPEDVSIEIEEVGSKKYFIITQETLIKLSQKYRIPLPRKLSDLKNMLLSLFRELDPKEIYKTKRLKSRDDKPVKVVLVDEDVVNRLLGIEEGEEKENENVEQTKEANQEKEEENNTVNDALGEIKEIDPNELDF